MTRALPHLNGEESDPTCPKGALGDVVLIHRFEIERFLRRDLAVEDACLEPTQMLLDLGRRAWAEQHHEELLVRRELAVLAVAERATAGRPGRGGRATWHDIGGQNIVPGETRLAHHGRGELG